MNNEQFFNLLKKNNIEKSEFDEYIENKTRLSALKKSVDTFTAKLKAIAIAESLEKVKLDDVNVSLTYQDKSSMDEDKLVELLENKGYLDAVLVVKKPDVEKVKQFVIDGVLKDTELNSCVIPNKIPVLKVSKIKKKKQKDIGDKVMESLSKKEKKEHMF